MFRYFLYACIMSAIFFSTTNLINYDDPAIQKTDQKAYIHIAENGFGKVEENGKGGIYSNKLWSHHLERWPLHVSVGVLSKLFKIKVWKVYQYINIFLIIFCIFTLASMPVSAEKKSCNIIAFTFLTFLFQILL